MRTDFVRKYATYVAKIRRSKRQSKNNFVVYYNYSLSFRFFVKPQAPHNVKPQTAPVFFEMAS